ncbi:HAMP domain-containing sensor histidine kinase [Streptomyces sp. CT34]|uniref:sensor histidine kinase n=1 Tax=Streptomyces sp. CT34 TaxID=1553907 RepID=UPI00068CF4C5|nr:HAMP domain-containing sensor histidine kinase [Streptomyces sp. CT34]
MLGKRLPIRLRAALAAALTAAVAFTAGALWLRNEVYASKMGDTRNRARASLDLIEQRYQHGNTQALFQSPDTWVIVDPAGRFVEGDPDLAPFVPDPLYGLPERPGPTVPIEQDLRMGSVSGDARSGSKQLAGRELRVVTSAFHAPGLLDGRPTAPVENLTLHILVTPQDAEEAVATVDHVLYAGLPAAVLLVALIVWTTTSRALHPVEVIQQRLRTITSRDLSLRVPVPPRQDEIARLAATTNDTLDRLEQAAEQQRRFTADASHELRTPLAALRADLEVALHYPDRTDWPDVVRGALGDTERLEQLIEDLLLLADLDNRSPSTAQPVDLAALARKAAAQARRHAPDSVSVSVSVRVDCPAGGGVTVHGDPRQLARLLRNLLDNAVRHARGRVLVTVSADAATATALVEVRDDGPGIPAEHHEKIFERFTRLDASRNRTSGGTGLGLAIAREIAHNHHGTLTLGETAPAAGAHFVVALPLPEGRALQEGRTLPEGRAPGSATPHEDS